jgi:Ca2+-binding EF-hand superfamily protein
MNGRPTSFYKQINGKKYDRALFNEAEDAAKKDGGITLEDAKALWISAMDGDVVTPTEHATLEYALKNFTLTDEAAEYLKSELYPKPKDTSYYKQIGGVKYDRQLLELSESLAKEATDGKVSHAQAKKLWESAADGPGVTSCESRTIEYALKQHPYTKEAEIYLLTQLQLEHDVLTLEEVANDIAADIIATTSMGKFLKSDKEVTPAATDKAEASKPSTTITTSTVEKFEVPKASRALAIADDDVKRNVSHNVEKTRTEALEEMQIRAEELEEEFGDMFDDMDTDGDGCLTKEEVKAYVDSRNSALEIQLGIGKWEDFVAALDTDGDGHISREEFITYCVHGNMDVETLSGFLFDAIDANGDNDLSFDEIKQYEWFRNPHIFQVLGIEDFQNMVASMDENNDGKVDRDEFVNFFKKKEQDGALSWKKSIETAKHWEDEGLSSGYRQDSKHKRKLDNNTCWDYAKGYCPRGARCTWKHNPQLTFDQSVLTDRKRKCVAVAEDCGLNLSNAALKELETLEDEVAEELIKESMDDVGDANFFIIKKVHWMRVPGNKRRRRRY